MHCLLLFFILSVVSNHSISVGRNTDWNFELSAKELVDSQWNEFKITYSKFYNNKTEELFRKKIFMENSIKAAKRNQLFAKGLVFTASTINQFSDLLHSEYLQTYTKCAKISELNETEQYATFIPPAHVTLPEHVDWRENGAVTPVKNQKRCGSCYSFAATGALEGQHYRKQDKLVSLSEQQIIDCSESYNNNGCGGGYITKSYLYIKDNGGIDTENAYPYENGLGECRYNSASKGATDKGVMAVSGKEKRLKAAVATRGPITATIDASHESFKSFKGGSVYYESECSSGNVGHSVLIVGYGTDPNDPHPDYWIVKNSWGKVWGEEGYFKIARNQKNHCGISTQNFYPLV